MNWVVVGCADTEAVVARQGRKALDGHGGWTEALRDSERPQGLEEAPRPGLEGQTRPQGLEERGWSWSGALRGPKASKAGDGKALEDLKD